MSDAEPDNYRLTMWLAIAEGVRITWADYRGRYAPLFFWSGIRRGERVVECNWRPQRLLTHGGRRWPA